MPVHYVFVCECIERVSPGLVRQILDEPPPLLPRNTGVRLYIDKPWREAELHRRCHIAQAAYFAPAWARRWWVPLRLQALIGWRAFWAAYLTEHRLNGFVGNAYEVEARKAEDPTEKTSRHLRLPPPGGLPA